MNDELFMQLFELACETPFDELPEFLGELEKARITAYARLVAAHTDAAIQAADDEDTWEQSKPSQAKQ